MKESYSQEENPIIEPGDSNIKTYAAINPSAEVKKRANEDILKRMEEEDEGGLDFQSPTGRAD
jgi:hypothetical protein